MPWGREYTKYTWDLPGGFKDVTPGDKVSNADFTIQTYAPFKLYGIDQTVFAIAITDGEPHGEVKLRQYYTETLGDSNSDREFIWSGQDVNTEN